MNPYVKRVIFYFVTRAYLKKKRNSPHKSCTYDSLYSVTIKQKTKDIFFSSVFPFLSLSTLIGWFSVGILQYGALPWKQSVSLFNNSGI